MSQGVKPTVLTSDTVCSSLAHSVIFCSICLVESTLFSFCSHDASLSCRHVPSLNNYRKENINRSNIFLNENNDDVHAYVYYIQELTSSTFFSSCAHSRMSLRHCSRLCSPCTLISGPSSALDPG